jgi:hypothetical protein
MLLRISGLSDKIIFEEYFSSHPAPLRDASPHTTSFAGGM